MHTSAYPNGMACKGMFAGTFVLTSTIESEKELQAIDAAELHKLEKRAREFFCGKDLSIDSEGKKRLIGVSAQNN